MKILIIDDEPEYRDVLQEILNINGYSADTVESGDAGLYALSQTTYDLILTDLIMDNGIDGMEFLSIAKERYPNVEVIVITGYGSVQNAVEAMRMGAFGYFVKSHDPDELILEIRKIEKFNQVQTYNTILKAQHFDSDVLLQSRNDAFNAVLEIANKVAGNDSNVLLLGESGVGKEVVARYIHKCRDNGNGPFVTVNCSAFPDSLLESELYGYEKGAFTGAGESRTGRFEAADTGILFMDEIGEISEMTQIKLLRSIETKEIQRLGSNRTISSRFKLISATNANLHEAINNGTFREDLFYRLSTITLELPPLRERREDIEDLTRFFLTKIGAESSGKIAGIEPELWDFLKQYDYPGNIREMRNIMERLVVLSDDGVLRCRDLPTNCFAKRHANKEAIRSGSSEHEFLSLRQARRDAEITHIRKALDLCRHNVSEAARLLET